MIGPTSTATGFRVDWDLGHLTRRDLLAYRGDAKLMLEQARAEAALADNGCTQMRDREFYVAGVHAALGDALVLIRHLDRQLARINERLNAMGAK